MTQNDVTPDPITPTRAIARRVREVRAARGWSAQQLADRCADLGMPDLDRSTVANIENGRRQRIGVDELLTLALALGVAPLHLAVPLEEDWYAIAPEHITGTGRARQWIRGNYPVPTLAADPALRRADRETYLAQQPEEEWTPPAEPTPEQQEARRKERMRALLDAEEAGLVEIKRGRGGAWQITPTDRAVETMGSTGRQGKRQPTKKTSGTQSRGRA